jgi:hypothetical protein
MSTPHRATPEQWAKCEEDARLWSGALNCILELRARIAALEAAHSPQPDKLDRLIALDAADPNWEPNPAMTELRAASAEARPAGGLVERVAARIEYGIDAELDPEGIARAAVRDVAAWLESESEAHLGNGKHWAVRMRSEADRG